MITEWDKLVNGAKFEAIALLDKRNKGSNHTNQREGHLVALRVNVLVDGDGNAIVWTIEPVHIKPGQRAKALLDLL